MVDEKYLNDIINRVGKEVFIKYYYYLKNGHNQEVITKMINEPFTDKFKRSRVSKGIKLFKENLHLVALKSIINSKKLNADVIDKAKEIYEKER